MDEDERFVTSDFISEDAEIEVGFKTEKSF